ncbi:MAG TPA: SpoIVB peptidase S55 domain-containing protein [Halanaerobiales bacterium]|nr:SpoIVB peptidase S55 domain-containing protein [Halanaerobiales bacterium]
MNRHIKTLVVSLIFLVVFSVPISAEKPPVMMVDEVKSGQTGYAKTVFEGTKIEEFPIEVINIIEGQSIDTDLILIKASGEKIAKAGGVASGMSGSPVYINDKLVGAISYKWQNADHEYALVTPILEMLDIKKEEDKASISESIKAAGTPIMVGGLSGRAFDRLKSSLDIADSRFVSNSSTTKQGTADFELKAGSAVAVQLVRGDVSVASIGTVTLVDNGEVYAFGHPFMNKGKTNYLMSGAYIDAIIPSRTNPFKIGSPLDKLLGVIESDRNAGIFGRLNKFPNIIPLTVTVEDKNLNQTKEVRTQIINDEKMLDELGSSIILQSIDSTLDRIGYGTSNVKITIMGSNLPDGKIVKENMYYSSNDIAVSTLSDYFRMMDMITRNPFKEINIFDMKVNVEVSKNHDIALIQEAEVLNKEVYPGSELDVKVILRPYRADSISRELSIKIPEDINTGMATLAISGGYGGLPNRRNPQEDNGNDLNHTVIEGYKSFDEMIKDYLEAPMNNELTLQVYPSLISRGEISTEPPAIEQKEEQAEEEPDEKADESETPPSSNKPKEKPEIKKQVYTDFVLEGNLTLDFEVKKIPEKSEDKNIPEDKKE